LLSNMCRSIKISVNNFGRTTKVLFLIEPGFFTSFIYAATKHSETAKRTKSWNRSNKFVWLFAFFQHKKRKFKHFHWHCDFLRALIFEDLVNFHDFLVKEFFIHLTLEGKILPQKSTFFMCFSSHLEKIIRGHIFLCHNFNLLLHLLFISFVEW
jgi:hypothetical protein